MQENRDFRVSVEPFGHRVEEKLLVGAELVEYRQNLELMCLPVFPDEESLALMRLHASLVPQYRICLLYRLFRDFMLLRQLVHRRQHLPVLKLSRVNHRTDFHHNLPIYGRQRIFVYDDGFFHKNLKICLDLSIIYYLCTTVHHSWGVVCLTVVYVKWLQR